MPERDDMNLDDLLADAAHPEPSDALMSRVLADALNEQPMPTARQKPDRWGVFADLGGWFGVSGLAAATCAGFLIGFSPDLGIPNTLIEMMSGGSAFSIGDSAEFDSFGWYESEGAS